MKEYLNRSIKEVITEFPEVEGLLEEYGIGCGPCSVGTCLLKDIVEIHSLSQAQERELMARMGRIIDPAKVLEIPRIEGRKGQAKGFTYSPPLKRLVEEHLLIKRWVALIPEVVKVLDLDSAVGRQVLMDGVDFIRSYADKYHHAKEEEILFKYFDEDLEVLKVMREEHMQARVHVKTMLESLDRRDRQAVEEHLVAYGELLSEHIRKEDEILYPWMDKNLSVTQVGELYARFNEVDDRMGFSSQKYEDFISGLEEKLLGPRRAANEEL